MVNKINDELMPLIFTSYTFIPASLKEYFST
jgi:hypothetical protein